MTEIPSSLKTLHELKDDQPVEVLAQAIIEHAARSRASDLFFASEEKAIMVSQRQLGRMQNLRPFSTLIGKRITNHIKAMAGIDLADRQIEQLEKEREQLQTALDELRETRSQVLAELDAKS